jgi:hypothetical protein
MEKYRTSHAVVLQDLGSLLPAPLELRFIARNGPETALELAPLRLQHIFDDILADLRLLLTFQVLLFLTYGLAQPVAPIFPFRFLTLLRAITLELDTKPLVLASLIKSSFPGSEGVLGVGLGLLHFCRQRRDVPQEFLD